MSQIVWKTWEFISGVELAKRYLPSAKTVMQDLKLRYKNLAINVAVLINQLPRTIINDAYSRQLIRSSSSPGTNYRAACRGKSMADYVYKLKIVEEELDESIYFLELLDHFNPDKNQTIKSLIKETNELLAMTVASIKKMKINEKFR
jgi:four helix bundle protein